jgi:flagella basal body P-ring formation protein FlgA
MNKLGKSLSLTVLVAMAMGGTSASAGHWEDKVVKQISTYWPKGSVVRAQIMGSTAGIPDSAELGLLSTDSYVGLVPVEWKWMQHGQAMHRSATATVQVRAKVAVARAPMGHGQALAADKIAFIDHEIGPLFYQGFFLNQQELDRRKAKGYVAPGSVLCLKNTTAPLLVEKGQTVQLTQKTGLLQLTAAMESLESGALGEWVRVSHPKTRKVIRAKVTGIGETGLN